MMANIVVGIVIVAILIGASYKLIDDRKRGVKCTGCPYAPQKGSDSKGNCGCP